MPESLVAIVTGSNSGIGRSAAVDLAAKGWTVYGTMRSLDKGAKLTAMADAAGVTVHPVVCDVTDTDSVNAAVAQIHAEAGRIDVLVNNAGVGGNATVEECTIDRFAEVMDVNLHGLVRCIQAVLPHMREQGSGSIVNVTSVIGRFAAAAQAPYVASKWAAEGMSQELAHEVAPFGIRVVIVEPGVIKTAIMAKNVDAPNESGAYDRHYQRLLDFYMVGLADPGHPSVVAETIYEAVTTDEPRLRWTCGWGANALTTALDNVSDEDWVALGAIADDVEYREQFSRALRPRHPPARGRFGMTLDLHDLIPEGDRWLFNEGGHRRLFDVLGAQPLTVADEPGRRFAVWAPEATRVWAVGDFSNWEVNDAYRLVPQGDSGIWAGVAIDATVGDRYKFRISTKAGYDVERADPVAFAAELPPATASVVTDLSYDWSDSDWIAARSDHQGHDRPISIYEMHVGSWRHAEAHRSLTWAELAEPLADHLDACGFTHVELLPIMEHPFYGSWGYQTTGYFAPTARYGLPADFMGFVDKLHERGIGVILDWVPSHFPADDFALGSFDGTHLYEHGDPKEGWHPDWKSYIFNYGRHEVRSLPDQQRAPLDRALSHRRDPSRCRCLDALPRLLPRVRVSGCPIEYGGRENLEAIRFLRELNTAIGAEHPDVITIAEESTAFPGVTRPADEGGLGFHYKWDMGWMHDTLEYLERDPIHRRFHHDEITFRGVYAFTEQYVLPLSHDEVVHGKGSILAKMPGDEWQQFANLRVLFGNQWLNPGKKLLFMGQEFGQGPEWNHDNRCRGRNWSCRTTSASNVGWPSSTRSTAASRRLHRNELDPDGFRVGGAR